MGDLFENCAGQVAESNRRATRLGEEGGGMNLSRIEEEEEGGLGTLAPTPYRFSTMEETCLISSSSSSLKKK